MSFALSAVSLLFQAPAVELNFIFPDMGSLFSSEEPTTIGWRPSKEEPFCPPEDWPYVWAIRDCEMLDWKLPLTPGGPPLSKDETLALADAQVTLQPFSSKSRARCLTAYSITLCICVSLNLEGHVDHVASRL